MPALATPVERMDYRLVERQQGFFDPYEWALHSLAYSISTARAVRENAVSYRKKPFKVGAVAMTLNSKKKQVSAFAGYNLKPDPEVDKVCAEMQTIGRAKREGFDSIPLLVVAGSTDPLEIRDVTGVATATLDPCDLCRDLLHESTVVVSVGADKDIMRVATGKQLFELYARQQEVERMNRTRRRKAARLAIPTLEVPVIETPDFLHLDRAHELYEGRVVDLRTIPEDQTRMIRAERLVQAVHAAALEKMQLAA